MSDQPSTIPSFLRSAISASGYTVEQLAGILCCVDLNNQSNMQLISNTTKMTVRNLQEIIALVVRGAVTIDRTSQPVEDWKAANLDKIVVPTPIATKQTKRSTKQKKPSKIDIAFESLTANPTNVDEVCKKFDVSLNVLKQHGRFDKYKDRGVVRVRKDKDTGQFMIFREVPVNV